MIGTKSTWKDLENMPWKSNILYINALILWLKISTLISSHTYTDANLMHGDLEVAPISKNQVCILSKNLKTENYILVRFREKQLFHCLPETSRKLPESKSQLLASRNGRMKLFCSWYFAFSCSDFYAIFIHYNACFPLIWTNWNWWHRWIGLILIV